MYQQTHQPPVYQLHIIRCDTLLPYGIMINITRTLGGAHVPPTKVFRRLTGSVNKTIVKPRVAAVANTYTSDLPDVNKFRVYQRYTIAEKAIRFRHPDYNPDQAQKLIRSSVSRHLSTRNISSKSMHAFLSNLANRQTDKRGQTHLPPPLLEVIIAH